MQGSSDALALAAVMQNIHTYYKQFQHLVQEDLQKGLAPIEKHLKACLPYFLYLEMQPSDAHGIAQMTTFSPQSSIGELFRTKPTKPIVIGCRASPMSVDPF